MKTDAFAGMPGTGLYSSFVRSKSNNTPHVSLQSPLTNRSLPGVSLQVSTEPKRPQRAVNRTASFDFDSRPRHAIETLLPDGGEADFVGFVS